LSFHYYIGRCNIRSRAFIIFGFFLLFLCCCSFLVSAAPIQSGDNVTRTTSTAFQTDNSIIIETIGNLGAINVLDRQGDSTGTSGLNLDLIPVAIPGNANAPTDPDGDGLYEDLNGNARLDFNDIVVMFNQMQWIEVNEPVSAFDFNGNGRIDFNDIVVLFGEIRGLPATGSITVTSTPSGAKIFINSADSGEVTPHTFSGQVAGSYDVYVTLAGYITPSTQTKTITKDADTPFDFTLTAVPPDTGSITVTSTPVGAEILLNNVDSGFTTPHTFTSQVVGSYDVYVTLAGYVTPATQTKAVTKDTETTLDFPLTPETGSITVTSTPSGAKIFINGADSGQVTPHTFTGQNVGSYDVYVTLTGYLTPVTQTKSVTKDTETTFAFTLSPETGSINVTSTPSGAKIFINGSDSGFTTPHRFTGQAVGSYNVYVTLTGYLTPVTQTKTVTKNNETTFNFPLSPISRAGIALTFDDNYVDQWYAIRNIFQQYNAHVTFFVSNFYELDQTQIDKLKVLQADGHEIAFHGYNHEDVVAYLQSHTLNEYMNNEIISGINLMKSNGFNPVDFAFPYGSDDPRATAAMTPYFLHMRDTYYDWDNTIFYQYGSNASVISGIGIDDNTYGNSLTDIYAGIAKAKTDNRILIFYCHEPVASNPGEYQTSYDRIDKILANVKNNNMTFYRVADIH
jgi:peptidoglycan/xylan/chitin deacetylase (PgdA/CDA1 family)